MQKILAKRNKCQSENILHWMGGKYTLPLGAPPSPPHAHCTFGAAAAASTSLPGHCNQRSMLRAALIAKFFKCFLVGYPLLPLATPPDFGFNKSLLIDGL